MNLLSKKNYFFLYCLIASGNASAQLVVKNAWVEAAPPNAKVYAAYMSLENPTATPLVITKISSSCCSGVMLHLTHHENDQVKMEHVNELAIPSRKQVELAPGKLHIMLMQPSQNLKIDEEIALKLHFSNGEQQIIKVPVKRNANKD